MVEKPGLKKENQVRAYDLGIPSLDSEVPVNIFTQDVQKRFVQCTLCEKLKLLLS